MDGQNGKISGGDQGVPKISEQITGEAGGQKTGGSEAGGQKAGGSKAGGQDNKNTAASKTGGQETGGGVASEKGFGEKIPGLPGIVPVEAPKKAAVKKSSSAANKELKDNLSLLLVGSFSLAAARLGEHWNISAEEADKIADPALKIMDRLGASEFMGKYSDFFALTFAVGIVIAPRIIVTKALMEQQRKEVKPNAGGNKKTETDPNTPKAAPRSRPANGISTKAVLNALDQ